MRLEINKLNGSHFFTGFCKVVTTVCKQYQ